MPQIRKEVKLENGEGYMLEELETFRFVIFTGETIALPAEYDEITLAELLTEAGRSYTFVDLTVGQGANKSDIRTLSDLVCYELIEGVLTATEKEWVWAENEKYTVKELPLGSEQGMFGQGSISGAVFTYSQGKNIVIDAVNYRRSWEITLKKTDSLTGVGLEGALFGLYSPDEADAMTDEAFEALGIDESLRTVTIGEGAEAKTYRLSETALSDANGWITWNALLHTEYCVRELKAPDGYAMSEETIMVVSEDYTDADEITVPNSMMYVLPETGGIGERWFTACGLALISGAVICYAAKRKRKIR